MSNPSQAKVLYFASGNTGKARELTELLSAEGIDIQVLSAKEIGGMPDVEENAETFEGNARLKAKALYALVPEKSGVLADDSGLCVDFLKGAPGVRSARYAGQGATDADNRKKLLNALQGVAQSQRRATFHCCLVFILPSGEEMVFHGENQGEIITEERGSEGFGYDALFVPKGWVQTYAEVSAEEKAKSSHRARAVEALARWWRTA